jgi:hypothetical protein
MYNNGKWDKPKVVMYCQIGGSLDMANFSINRAIHNSGLPKEDFDIVFLCWKTPKETYYWLGQNNFKYVEMEYDEGKGFLWNLYKGWNLGHEIGFEYADYVCPIATDHSFYKNWLANLLKNGKENRIVNCKLIEPGVLQTIHTTKNFGITNEEEFQEEDFLKYAEVLYQEGENKLTMNAAEHGHRLDAMPFLLSRDVWEKFGPMNKWIVDESPDPRGQYVNQITGDTDFFNRCESGGVEVTKALDAISYHCGGVETRRNQQKGIYT